MVSTSEAIHYLLESSKKIKNINNFIDDSFNEASGQTIESENPATGQVWLQFKESSAENVDAAVKAASAAFESWSTTSREYRSGLLNKVADILETNLEGLAFLESKDQGKTVKIARSIEIPRCVHNFRTFASAILHHTNSSVIQEQPVKALNFVKNDPIGVAALISPWNLPLYLISFKLAPALATGNTVVCKPSELTSATAWVLFHAFAEAGFPAGVVNLVLGTGPVTGQALVSHPKTSLISFTGSTVVGRKIAGIAAAGLKKVSLELGGKNAAIIFPSVNMEADMATIVRSCFANQGEICLCTSRLYVHNTIFQHFVDKFVNETNKLKVGDPEEVGSDLGALVSRTHFNKVSSYIDLAKQEGLEIACGGANKDSSINLNERCQKGYFIAPTVIIGAADESRLMQEEIFGPLVCITSFEGVEEVIQRANALPYGLSASVWSKDVDEITTVSTKLRVGTVWCNCWLVRELNMPFGGTKESGIGREGVTDSIHFFTEAKNVCLKLN
uniref:Aldehyde dehydrogenase domain-containing protein n=1 Tax=Ditylenchus dipsaci TaxID=166011 RepID=A0A915E3H7_9BILA